MWVPGTIPVALLSGSSPAFDSFLLHKYWSVCGWKPGGPPADLRGSLSVQFTPLGSSVPSLLRASLSALLPHLKTCFPAVSELCKDAVKTHCSISWEKRSGESVPWVLTVTPVVTLIRWNCVVAWLLRVMRVSGPGDKARLSVMFFRRWGFGKWLGHEAGDLVNGSVPVL